MEFLKKLTGGKSASHMAKTACKQLGIEPKMLIQQIFAKVCGGSKDKDGNPSMDFGSLMKLMKVAGIMKGSEDEKSSTQKIFDNRKGEEGKMNFDQFYDGLGDIADEKYKDDKKCKTKDDRLKKLEDQIIVQAKDFDDWTGAE